ncbi:MAG: hypothetical protein ACO1QB_09260 [Verrucomicrobiales bacterium]
MLAFTSSLSADHIKYKVTGKVTATSRAGYELGKPYELLFTIDTSAIGQPGRTAWETIYQSGILGLEYRYDNAAVRHSITAQVNMVNNSQLEPVGDAMLVSYMGLADFDSLVLEDESGQVFASRALPTDLNLSQFKKASFHLMWGTGGMQSVSFSIDAITRVERFPAITSWSIDENGMIALALTLRPEGASYQQRTVLEKSSELGDETKWSPIAYFDTTETFTTYREAMHAGQGGYYYRISMVTE